MKDKEKIRSFIRENYADVASKNNNSKEDCCSGSCCCGGRSNRDVSVKIGYLEEDISNSPSGANLGLGCGNPIAIAALKEGETVLDLGSGGGFDCFLVRNKVGDIGYVIGVDMTPEMIKLSRENLEKTGYANVEFRLGEIEHLPVADESVDVIISNCVINLSLDKQQVFNEAFRVLKSGGRISVSDIVATKRLPEEAKHDIKLIAGCIGGAEYVEDLRNMLLDAGFTDIRLAPKDNSEEIIKSWFPDMNIEEYVASYMIEALKGRRKPHDTEHRKCCDADSNCCC